MEEDMGGGVEGEWGGKEESGGERKGVSVGKRERERERG